METQKASIALIDVLQNQRDYRCQPRLLWAAKISITIYGGKRHFLIKANVSSIYKSKYTECTKRKTSSLRG